MIEYVKIILLKVSFDKMIFQKELIKALKNVVRHDELRDFRQWCYQEFSGIHPHVLNFAFQQGGAGRFKVEGLR